MTDPFHHTPASSLLRPPHDYGSALWPATSLVLLADLLLWPRGQDVDEVAPHLSDETSKR